jgi:hypothetical protein
VFVAEVSQNSSPNSPVGCSHQNQCYALAWGSCPGLNVVRSWGFVRLSNFPLLLALTKVLDLGLAEFHKLFIELWHCFGPLSD